MDDATENQLDAALVVRRRFQAELIASEATLDAATSTHVARLKLKIEHLDAMIGRLEQKLGYSGWWNVRPMGGHTAPHQVTL